MTDNKPPFQIAGTETGRIPAPGFTKGLTQATNFELVELFQRTMHVPMAQTPKHLAREEYMFRLRFLQEEINEIKDAIEAHFAGVTCLERTGTSYDRSEAQQNLADIFDGLLDLAYVAMGTAAMMGLPWEHGFNLVQIANMKKIPTPSADASKRGNKFDVIKPPGWMPPDLFTLVEGLSEGHELW